MYIGMLPFIFSNTMLSKYRSIGGAHASLNSEAKNNWAEEQRKKRWWEQIFQPCTAQGVEYFFKGREHVKGLPQFNLATIEELMRMLTSAAAERASVLMRENQPTRTVLIAALT
jgi:hypothetical protein